MQFWKTGCPLHLTYHIITAQKTDKPNLGSRKNPFEQLHFAQIILGSRDFTG